MNDYFESAFEYLLQNEGLTFTNDPKDPGGPTKFGVTQRAYERFVSRLVTTAEMKDLSLEDAKLFYLKTYWEPLLCHQINFASTAICIFDSAILHGEGTAAMMTQKCANICGAALKIDGIIGVQSITMLNVIKPEKFLVTFCSLVLARIDTIIESNPALEIYRDGWTTRANRLLTLTNKNSEIKEA